MAGGDTTIWEGRSGSRVGVFVAAVSDDIPLSCHRPGRGVGQFRELGEALGRRQRTRLIRLAKLGMTTVEEMSRLDEHTASLSGTAVGYLPRPDRPSPCRRVEEGVPGPGASSEFTFPVPTSRSTWTWRTAPPAVRGASVEQIGGPQVTSNNTNNAVEFRRIV